MTNPIKPVRSRAMHLASRCLMTIMVLGAAAWANAAAATSTLQNITYKTLPGGRVELRMNFDSSQVPDPRVFTTDNPPRIAVDFPDTANDAARHQDIGIGTTTGVSAVSAGGRTRVVVELMQASTYKSHVEGNSLVMVVNNGGPSAASHYGSDYRSVQGAALGDEWPGHPQYRFPARE